MLTNLATKYSLTPGSNPTLEVKYTNIAGVQSALPAFYGWAAYMGMSDGAILQVDALSACHNNEVWATHGYIPGSAIFTQINNSRARIEWPDGRWDIRMPLLGSLGEYFGQGSSIFSLNASTTTYGTEMRIDHANWIGAPAIRGVGDVPFRTCFVGSTHGQGVNGSYLEGLRLHDVYFNGGLSFASVDTAYESYGYSLTNLGSNSHVYRVKADQFNNAGGHVIAGIPVKLSDVRHFRNNQAGLLLEGCALATVRLDAGEFDDNPIAVEMVAGRNSQSAGCKTGTFSIKTENGKNTTRTQIGIHARGQFCVTVTDFSAAYYNNVRPDCVVRWDTANANSKLEVNSYCDSGTSIGGGPFNLIRTNSGTFPININSDGFGFCMKGGQLVTGQRS